MTDGSLLRFPCVRGLPYTHGVIWRLKMENLLATLIKDFAVEHEFEYRLFTKDNTLYVYLYKNDCGLYIGVTAFGTTRIQ
jgi:hypothetical protein